MKTLLPSFVIAAALCSWAVESSHAAVTVPHARDGLNVEIPDAPGFGGALTVSDTRGFSVPFEVLTDLSVWLRFEGSDGAGGLGTMWNGDLYVTLTHESGAFLATLGSNSPAGSWTLAISDLESGNLGRMTGWGMTLTGVPEAEEYAVMAGAGLALFWGVRRWRRNGV